MGMPVIASSCVSRQQAMADVIQSIALQEAALAHILNTQGEKMQRVIAAECLSLCDLATANQSVCDMIDRITCLENILKENLALANDACCR